MTQPDPRFYRGSIMIPLADVQHVEYWKHQGEPYGIRIITCHTKWNFEADNWDNNAYLPQDEVAAFEAAWEAYRRKLEDPLDVTAELRMEVVSAREPGR